MGIIMSDDWKKSKDRRLVVLSATQIETWNLCHRKWWLSKVRKLPQPRRGSQVFGTVLHAVAERYLNADDRGYDPKTGKPVDLFPEGWHIAKSRFSGDEEEEEGECSLAEQDIIKRLIPRAIEEGVLERRPGRAVEAQFRRTIIHLGCPECDGHNKKCETCGGDGKGTHFQITGFIDLCYRDEVQDHKTTKSMRWAKSRDALRQNPQMLIYAKMLIEDIKEQGGAIPEEITLRHNVYVKDPDDLRIRKTEVVVSVEQIENHWKQIVQDCDLMDRIRRRAETWDDIPDPPDPSASCNAFGGCPYRSICSGSESELGYEKRFDSHQKAAYAQQTPTTPGEHKMDFAAKLAQKTASLQAASNGSTPAVNPLNAPKIGPAKPAAPEPAPAAEATVRVGNFTCRVWGKGADGSNLLFPPWSVPGVQVNGGIGFNTNGDPDKVSDIKAKVAKQPTSDMFDLTPVGDGTIYWEGKKGTPAEGMSGFSPLSPNYKPGEEIGVESRVALANAPAPVMPPEESAPAPEPEVEPETEPETAPQIEASAAVAAPATSGKRGRPAKGFILAINCAATSGIQKAGSGRHVYDLHEVLQRLGEQMAESAGVESFYDLDAFSRRDALAKIAPALAAEFGADIVSACGIGTGVSDAKVLCDALRPHAGMVFIAES